MGDLHIRLLLRQLGKVHPAPGSEARVMALYRAWVRDREAGPGKARQGPAGGAGQRGELEDGGWVP